MSDSTLPIACTLTDAEFREREQAILRQIMRAVLERKELADGYAFRFAADDRLLREITEMIILERKCCPFLDFKILVASGGASLWVELTGAPGAKEFIAATFK